MNEPLSLNEYLAEHCTKSMENALQEERHPLWQRNCPDLQDINFVRLGLLRCMSTVNSGRHFLQTAREVHGELYPHSTYFKSLHSLRRTNMLEAVEKQSYKLHSETLEAAGVDYLKQFPELGEYTVEAADGHFVDHAYHTAKGRNGKAYAAGFIYAMNLRNGLLRPFSHVTNGTQRHHEMPVFRNYIESQLREKKQREKHLYVYDKAATDFAWWNKQKRQQNFMISVAKENSAATIVDLIPFDDKSVLNTGVEGYAIYETSGIKFSVVHYRDPETAILHSFITTLPESINPGTIAMLYFKRWTIEKAYNNSKSDLKEAKAWSSCVKSLKNQMRLTTMTYNIMRVFEEVSKRAAPGLVHPSDKKYAQALEKRECIAKKSGGFVNPLFFHERIARISSFTIRSVQNAIIAGRSLLSVRAALVAQLVPRVRAIGEH